MHKFIANSSAAHPLGLPTSRLALKVESGQYAGRVAVVFASAPSTIACQSQEPEPPFLKRALRNWQLSGITDEVRRAMRHLDIGEWRSITFETQVAVVAMSPSADASLVVVAASRATPLGLVRRLLERCGRRASAWLERGGEE